MIKIGIAGATGRMGQMVVREVYHNLTCELSAALAREGNPLIGEDIGTIVGFHGIGVDVTSNTPAALERSDVLIDFSTPEGCLALMEKNEKTPMVIGVTGFSEENLHTLKEASIRLPIVLAPNTSMGATILKKISRLVAESLGPDFDIDILDTHHRNKVDSPSGTALDIQNKLAEVPGFHLNKKHDGPREQGAIHTTSSRTGGVIGDHSVTFTGEKELISINHRALDRSLFAQGAIKAAQWVKEKAPGLYTMEDVLGI